LLADPGHGPAEEPGYGPVGRMAFADPDAEIRAAAPEPGRLPACARAGDRFKRLVAAGVGELLASGSFCVRWVGHGCC
jgi:hypothetical protein